MSMKRRRRPTILAMSRAQRVIDTSVDQVLGVEAITRPALAEQMRRLVAISAAGVLPPDYEWVFINGARYLAPGGHLRGMPSIRALQWALDRLP